MELPKAGVVVVVRPLRQGLRPRTRVIATTRVRRSRRHQSEASHGTASAAHQNLIKNDKNLILMLFRTFFFGKIGLFRPKRLPSPLVYLYKFIKIDSILNKNPFCNIHLITGLNSILRPKHFKVTILPNLFLRIPTALKFTS